MKRTGAGEGELARLREWTNQAWMRMIWMRRRGIMRALGFAVCSMYILQDVVLVGIFVTFEYHPTEALCPVAWQL